MSSSLSTGARAVPPGHPDLLHRLGAAVGIDQLDRLLRDLAPDDRAMALPQRRLVNPEFVGSHPALDHGLAQPPGAGNQDHVAEAALGIQGEDHARRAEVAADHLLHPD